MPSVSAPQSLQDDPSMDEAEPVVILQEVAALRREVEQLRTEHHVFAAKPNRINASLIPKSK